MTAKEANTAPEHKERIYHGSTRWPGRWDPFLNKVEGCGRWGLGREPSACTWPWDTIFHYKEPKSQQKWFILSQEYTGRDWVAGSYQKLSRSHQKDKGAHWRNSSWQRWYNLSINKRNYNVFKTSNNLKSTIAWYSKQKKTKLKPASPVQTIHQVNQINNEHISLCKSLPANKWRKIKRTGILPVYRAHKKSHIKGWEHKPRQLCIMITCLSWKY